MVRKFVLLIPLIYLLPHLFPGSAVMAVYMAEPIADVLAVTFTSILFLIQFKKILKRMRKPDKVQFPLFQKLPFLVVNGRLDK
mgnify:CR=1 FL=1